MQIHEGIYKGIKFIEDNLKEPLSIKDVADAAGYSLYHFTRIFNTSLGHSPYDYIMRRRLSEAVKELIETDKKIIDIAFDYQFNNPETFSRAFQRMFRLLPNEVKKNKSIDNLICKSEISYDYLMHINKGTYLKPEIVEMEPLHIIGMASLVKIDIGIMIELWERLKKEISSIKNRIMPEKYYSISFYPINSGMHGFFYMAGIEVDSLDYIPEIMVGKKISSLKYAKFIHKGRFKDLHMTLDYIYQTWLPKSGCKITAPFEIEYYGVGYKGFDNPDSESDIFIPVE